MSDTNAPWTPGPMEAILRLYLTHDENQELTDHLRSVVEREARIASLVMDGLHHGFRI